jgi:uncharacterized protein (DUF885 family)
MVFKKIALAMAVCTGFSAGIPMLENGNQGALAETLPLNNQTVEGAAEASTESRYDRLVDTFFDFVFDNAPSWGTNVGLHQYDNKLENLSKAHLAEEFKKYKEFLGQFENFEGKDKLPLGKRDDLALVIATIKANLLDYEQIKSFERDPDKYPSLIADSVFSLTKRDFAPLKERLASVVAREEQAPSVLQQARENLIAAKVPRIYAKVALEQLPGTVEMIKTTIPTAFKDVKDEALMARYKAANDKLLKEIADYETFIKTSILPASCEPFAIGRDAFVKKIAYEEMEDEDLDVLLKRGYDELHRLQGRFKAVSHEINPALSTSDCFAEVAKSHPTPDQLVPGTAAVLDGLRSFCLDKNLVTIPSKEQVTVAETPSFLRALTFASMDTPGPYETKAKEAYYYVTPAEKDWDAKHVEEHMRFYSYADLINTSVHEAYPGHYVQFLWQKTAPTKVRKLLGCSSNAEGWAHYCEEMAIQEGLGNVALPGATGDKAALKLEFVQLHDALLRACRYIVGIEMHCNGTSYDNAIAFFMKEGYMEKANAERETKRGTKDATYMVYTLGKLKILALREDYKKKMGDKYTLKDFHDRFLRCGFPPLKIVRAEMLAE